MMHEKEEKRGTIDRLLELDRKTDMLAGSESISKAEFRAKYLDSRAAFPVLIATFRKIRELTVDDLASALGVGRDDVIALETVGGKKPSINLLHRFAKHFELSYRRLCELAGLAQPSDPNLRDQLVGFAFQSKVTDLTGEEKELLKEGMTELLFRCREEGPAKAKEP